MNVNYAKLGTYAIALLLFAGVAAVALAVSGVFILAGFLALLVALSGSGVILLGMKFFGLVPENHPVLHIKRAWHWAIEIPARITLVAVRFMQKLPVLKTVMAEMYGELSDEKIIARLEAYFRTPKFEHEPYLYGDLARVANAEYPREVHKDLWFDVPAGYRTSLLEYSRTKNGKTVAKALAPNVIDSKLVAQTARRAALVGFLWLAISLVVWHPTMIIGAGVHGTPVQRGGVVTQDFWSPEDRSAAMESQAALYKRVETVREIKAKVLATAVALPLDAAASLLFALLVGLGAWRGMIRLAVNSRIQPFARPTPDTDALYKKNQHNIIEARNARAAQIEKLDHDQTEKVFVGVATGRSESLNMLGAPRKGAPISLSFENFCDNVIIFGGIGGGKSIKVLAKKFRRLLQIRQKNKAMVSAFVTDSKGVLYESFLKVAKKLGMLDDCIVIGTKPGQVAMDLCRGKSPQFIIDVLANVKLQRDNGESDAFFTPSSLLRMLNVAIVAQAYMQTDDAVEYVREFNELPYSLAAIARLSCESAPFTLNKRWRDAIIDAVKTGKHKKGFGQYLTPELFDTMHEMTDAWFAAPDKTTGGVVMTIKTMFMSLTTLTEVRRAFCTGLAENTITVDEFWGKLVMADLPIAGKRGGLASNMVQQFIKMSLFDRAADRHTEGLTAKEEWMFFFGDEYQNSVAAGGGAAYDDGKWPNECRASKFAYCIATQVVPSIKQKMPEQAAKNFLSVFRNRFALTAECKETTEYVTEHIGEVERMKVGGDEGVYESYWFQRMQTGLDIFEMVQDKPRLVEVPTDIIRSCWAAIEHTKQAVLPTDFADTAPLYPVDLRFVTPMATGFAGGIASGTGNDRNMPTLESYMNALGAAHHRAEDRTREALRDYYSEPVVKHSETTMIHSNNRCLAYVQNADRRTFDVIELSYAED